MKAIIAASSLLFLGLGVAATAQPGADALHGKYLILTSGCNDCHTPGWGESKGSLAEDKWLTGNPVGYRGGWGTSYAHNLRTHFQGLSVQDWITQAKTSEMDPPMPWYSLRVMSEGDLKDIYAFIQGLGAAGTETPDTVPPDQEPVGQYVSLVPLHGR